MNYKEQKKRTNENVTDVFRERKKKKKNQQTFVLLVQMKCLSLSREEEEINSQIDLNNKRKQSIWTNLFTLT